MIRSQSPARLAALLPLPLIQRLSRLAFTVYSSMADLSLGGKTLSR